MKIQTYILAAAISAFAIGSATAGSNIGYTNPNFDHVFQQTLRDAAKAYAKKNGCSIQIEDAKEDVNTQISQIKNFIANKVDGIVVGPVSTDSTPQMTKLAVDAGIPIAYVNRRPADVDKLGGTSTYVGSDNFQAGTLQAQAVCKIAGGRGNAVLLEGTLSNEDALNRTNAVKKILGEAGCSGIKIVAEQQADWDRTKAADVVSNWIASGKNFNSVFANNDEMALGAVNALKAAGLNLENYIIAGIDATDDAIAALKAGDLKVTVFQDAAKQARDAVAAVVKAKTGEKLPAYTDVPFKTVTSENADSFK
jgi:inositol transport system substrate-binding protein